MAQSLVELRTFLSDVTRPDVQLTALKLLLSLSSDSDFCQHLSDMDANSNGLIDDLLRLCSAHQTASLPILLAIFINISSHSRQIAAKLTESDSFVKQCLLSNSAISVRSAQLLSNLSHFCPMRLHEQIFEHDSCFLSRIFDLLILPPTEENKANATEKPETFFGYLLTNLSTAPSAARYIATNHLTQLMALLGRNVPMSRRAAALNILFNLSMFDDLHELLLQNEDHLLSSLLWPLIDSEDRLDEDEIARLPIQLQYWEGCRNNAPEIGDKILRTLYQLCATRHGRQCLRGKGIYALLRELDRATSAPGGRETVGEGRICTFIGSEEGAWGSPGADNELGYAQVLRALIGMLIRSEGEMGVAEECLSIRHLGSADRLLEKVGTEVGDDR